MPDKDLLTDREAAAALDCSRSTLWRWAGNGTVPKPIKIGGLTRWRRTDLDAAISDAAAQREAA